MCLPVLGPLLAPVALGLTLESSLSLKGNICWIVSVLTAKLLIPLLEVNDEVEALAPNVDLLDIFELKSFDKLLNLTGICCLISCLSPPSAFEVSLVALIKCKLARDSFFKLPPVITLLEGVIMALLEEVMDELFLMPEADPDDPGAAKLLALGEEEGVLTSE